MGGAITQGGKVAKERLSIMLVQSRAKENEIMKFNAIDLPALQQEVRDVVAKYMKVDQNKPITVSVNQQGEYDFLEINFPLQDINHIHKVRHVAAV